MISYNFKSTGYYNDFAIILKGKIRGRCTDSFEKAGIIYLKSKNSNE